MASRAVASTSLSLRRTRSSTGRARRATAGRARHTNTRRTTLAAIDPESATHIVSTVTDAHLVDAAASSTSGPLADLANFLAPAADKGLYGKVSACELNPACDPEKDAEFWKPIGDTAQRWAVFGIVEQTGSITLLFGGSLLLIIGRLFGKELELKQMKYVYLAFFFAAVALALYSLFISPIILRDANGNPIG